MDRDSLRRLRAQPGYLKFLSAATLARVSDEMFGVGVVLLVLDRTDSPGLAGATVAAITLPSLFSGPLLGAWLDLTGRRDADGDRPDRDHDRAGGARGARRPRPKLGDSAGGGAGWHHLPALVRRLHQHDPHACAW